jgi:hypothetical protein
MRCFFISSTPDVDQSFLQRLLHIRSHHADMAKVRVLQIYSVLSYNECNLPHHYNQCYGSLTFCYGFADLDTDPGFIHLTIGSGSGSGSCSFRQVTLKFFVF